MSQRKVLGVDIGGVIIDRVNDGTDTSFFSDNYLQTTAVPGAFEALRRLVDERFGENVFLVSKCGVRVQQKTLHWLDHHSFYEKANARHDHVFFCRARHEKAGICESLGVTHFIDDRLEILGNLTMVPTLYLFQSQPNEVRRFVQFLDRVKKVETWQDVVESEFGE